MTKASKNTAARESHPFGNPHVAGEPPPRIGSIYLEHAAEYHVRQGELWSPKMIIRLLNFRTKVAEQLHEQEFLPALSFIICWPFLLLFSERSAGA